MRARRSEPHDTVAVVVTFLRMDVPPVSPRPPMPAGGRIERVGAPTVAFYRYLYNTVGFDYLWWLRRIMPDRELAHLLNDPLVELHVLYRDGEPAGFFELDGRYAGNVNLSYFGLMPRMIGTGAGPGFLRQAIDAAWSLRPRTLTVNTCTADHPRALPNYVRAGFAIQRSAREVWDIPVHLGMRIPDRLRA